MKDIKAIMSEVGIDIPEDKADEFSKLFNENYKTIAEVQGKSKTNESLKAQVDELTNQLEEANETLEKVKSETDPEKMKELQSQIEEYQKTDEERRSAIEESSQREKFNAELTDALGGREFASDIIRDAVAEKAFELRKSNPDMAADVILANVVGDGEGVWKNPQQDVKKMQPTVGSSDETTIETMDDIAAHDSDYLLKHMDQVKAVLKSQGVSNG